MKLSKITAAELKRRLSNCTETELREFNEFAKAELKKLKMLSGGVK